MLAVGWRMTAPFPGTCCYDQVFANRHHRTASATQSPQEPSMDLNDRHPGTRGIARFFEYGHLPESLQPAAERCHDLAEQMIAQLPDGPELTAGLRKLLEAKDCFVRAALD